MHGTIAAKGDSAPIVKRRTITLTNRSPIRIVENDWPVIAQGMTGSDDPYECGVPWGWEMSIRVRDEKDKKKDPFTGHIVPGRTIIHASYKCHDETHEFDVASNQIVRVGRLLEWRDAATDLWKHIREVGEELRVRIHHEHLRRHVTSIVDDCFAQLKPHDE